MSETVTLLFVKPYLALISDTGSKYQYLRMKIFLSSSLCALRKADSSSDSPAPPSASESLQDISPSSSRATIASGGTRFFAVRSLSLLIASLLAIFPRYVRRFPGLPGGILFQAARRASFSAQAREAISV